MDQASPTQPASAPPKTVATRPLRLHMVWLDMKLQSRMDNYPVPFENTYQIPFRHWAPGSDGLALLQNEFKISLENCWWTWPVHTRYAVCLILTTDHALRIPLGITDVLNQNLHPEEALDMLERAGIIHPVDSLR